jgi:predicted permease
MHTLRYALRTLLRTPGLTAVVVLSVAAGIGANTAIFSFLGTTVLRPLPAVPADVLTIQVKNGTRLSGTSWVEYRDVRERLAPFAGVTAQGVRALYIEEGARTERVWSQFVSDNFFPTLGIRPALGRFFRPEEASSPGSQPVAVISHGFWQKRFGGSPDALGQTVRLNQQAFTVIGVTPPKFQGGVMALNFDVWVPFSMIGVLAPDAGIFSDRGYRMTQLDAVLRPGVSSADVQRQLDLTARSLAGDFPDSNREITFELRPIWRGTRSGALLMPVYAALQTFAVLLLGVVCINTANLLLARASVRRREIGIRLAVGAGPARIVRQLLTESVLVALAGTTLGILAAVWSVDAIQYLKMPTSVPVRLEPVFDRAALLFAIGLGAASGILFGLAPALELARIDVLSSLRGGAGAIAGRNRFRDFLVGAEVAVALVVLILAGLFYRSFHNAQSVNSGYTADRVLLASVDLMGRTYNSERRMEFVRQVHARLADHPQLEAAAIAYKVPLELHGMPKATIEIDGAKLASNASAQVIWSATTPGYFATMGIQLIAGRDVAPLQRTDLPLDAVINETAARTYWPGLPSPNGSGASALGRKFSLMGKTYEVVGIARDAKYESLGEIPHPAVWPTLRMGVMSAPNFYVRPRSGDPLAFLPMLHAIVSEVDADLAVYEGRTLAQHIDNNLAIQRVCARFLSALAPLALVLAAIGLYAVLAYAVAQRTQEIGVRLTLGATPRGVILQILRQGMKVVSLGAAVGWLVALTCGWYLQSRLIDVPVGDPTVYLGIPAVLLVVALFACWLPARRAAAVDPIQALRTE